jgi:hypothetical protein
MSPVVPLARSAAIQDGIGLSCGSTEVLVRIAFRYAAVASATRSDPYAYSDAAFGAVGSLLRHAASLAHLSSRTSVPRQPCLP